MSHEDGVELFQFGDGGIVFEFDRIVFSRPTRPSARRVRRFGTAAAGVAAAMPVAVPYQRRREAGSVMVRTESDAVVLTFQSRSWGTSEWKSTEQRVPLTWTACHLGGHRPWFVCSVCSNGRYCGRRAAVLYGAGELFACRRCYGLAYASQNEAVHHRGLGRARKIRMLLGGSPNLLEEFPERPKGMHRRTYGQLRRAYDRWWD